MCLGSGAVVLRVTIELPAGYSGGSGGQAIAVEE